MTPAELARNGDVDALFELMDLDSSSRADRDAYKWLWYADDLGHDTGGLIGDVIEVSSLRYDDDGYELAVAHWELAVAYLQETDGFEFDAKLATAHLDEALSQYSLEQIAACTNEKYSAETVLRALSGKQKALLEEFFEDTPYRHIRHKMWSLKRLREIESVPAVILQHVATSLAEAVRELVGDDVQDGVFAARTEETDGEATRG